MMELLSPAGSFDALKAAVQNGADAVYLGLKEYSARSSAENFTRDSLREAVFYCHTRGVKVHLALNTLMDEAALDSATAAGCFAQEVGVDALIVQDLGLAKRLRACCTLPLHASTQMTVYNPAGLAQVRELGFNRCIPARELSLIEIKQLCDMGLAEIEVFGHGALCMGYSGQCLFSYALGGRSGNKGTCAQPCRLPYAIFKGDRVGAFSPAAYHLSPQDLCTLPFLDRLIATGAHALKIEGRLKSPEYVAIVTRIYREALDRIQAGAAPYYTEKDMSALALSFCRTGFTSGHMLGKMPSSAITLNMPGRTGLLCGKTVSAAREKKLSVPVFDIDIFAEQPIRKGDGLVFRPESTQTQGDRVGESSEGIVNIIRSHGEDCGEKAKTGALTLTIAGKAPKQQGCRIYKTYDKALFDSARQSYETGAELRRVPIRGIFFARPGAPITLEVTDPEGRRIVCTGKDAELAKKDPTSFQSIYSHLDTLGNTPYKWKELSVDVSDNIFLPVSELKKLRRAAVDKLTEQRTAVKSEHIPASIRENAENKALQKALTRKEENGKSEQHAYTILFYLERDFLRWMETDFQKTSPLKRIYLPLTFFKKDSFKGDRVGDSLALLRQHNVEIFGILPWINKGKSLANLAERIKNANDFTDGYLAQNIGDIRLLAEYAPQHRRAADISLNACNSESVAELVRSGFDTVTLSPEITQGALETILEKIQWGELNGILPELLYSGPIPVMRSEHCAIGTAAGNPNAEKCGQCHKSCGAFYMRDRVGHKNPILCDSETCRMMILSGDRVDSRLHFPAEKISELKAPCLLRMHVFGTDFPAGKKIRN